MKPKCKLCGASNCNLYSDIITIRDKAVIICGQCIERILHKTSWRKVA